MALARHRMLRDAWTESCSLTDIATDAYGDLTLVPAGASVGTVELLVPLDAGEESSWRRVVVEAEVPEGTRVLLEVAADAAANPATRDYRPSPSLDLWLPSLLGEPGIEGAPIAEVERLRFLWLRVTLETQLPGASPRVRQIRAQTRGEEYLAELPVFYAEDDAVRGHFLGRMLEWLGSDFGDVERELSGLARRIDPAFARREDLAWLAEWLGWSDLPEVPTTRLREIVEGLFALSRVRGTLPGLTAIIRVFTGIEVHIVEHFWQRPTWILGERELGIDSGLSRPADGMVVPGGVCAWEASDTAPLVVGDAVVGAQGPLEREAIGAPLFDDDAHRFTVFVPPGAICSDGDLARLRTIIDREKPAHTDYHLCVLTGMELGGANHIGVNAYIGFDRQAQGLGAARLGVDTLVQDRPGKLRLGVNDRIVDTTSSDRGNQ